MSLKESYQKHRRAYFVGIGCLVLILGYWAYAHAKSKDREIHYGYGAPAAI